MSNESLDHRSNEDNESALVKMERLLREIDGDKPREVLVAMLQLRAVSNGARATADEIAKTAFGHTAPKLMEKIRGMLKRELLIETKGSRGGGARLTTLGEEVAKRIKEIDGAG